MDEAIKNPYNVTIANKELDLIIPLTNSKSLEEIVNKLKEIDRKGVEPWIDLVIIVKTKGEPIQTLKQFVDKHFVSITRGKEEFYSILTDEERKKALEKYLDNLCEKVKIGKLERSDVVFCLSQVNIEFAKYLSSIQNQLKIF